MLNVLILAGAIASATPFIESLKNTTNCSDNEFFCDNFECIPHTKQCDGTKDCSDGSDERDCDLVTCKSPDFFKCHNNRCISHSFVCDGQNDCEDFSDEENCTDFLQNLKRNSTCAESEWQCTDRLCIPKEWVCNGQNDCLDGSDEVLGCSTKRECDDGFRCKNGHCIFKEWRCDGQDDCRDNSDEENCDVQVDPKDCIVENQHFLCNDGKTCVMLSQVCDNRTQCPDKSDEGTGCTKDCDGCNHECVHLPQGPKCVCPKGYYSVGEKFCQDINECEIYGICDHRCRNTPGSYQCVCDDNYSLQSDNKSCKAHFGEAAMFFSSKKEIRAYHLRSEVYYAVAKNLKQVVGVDFDGEFVYWTDIFSEHESIVRSLKNGKKRELVVTSGLGAPEDLQIDYITKNIYFTDAEMQHIGVCTKDGAHCTVLLNQDIHKPRGIALNPLEGEMFWTDWGHTPQIARSLMDGSNPSPFVTSDIHWPNGLALDQPNSRLYWTDAKSTTIESINLDGTDRRVILKGVVKHPYAIAVFENRLYWSDWATHSIESCEKFTGKDHHTLIKEENEYIYGISIYHPNNHKNEKEDSCLNSMCSDICLLKGRSYSCRCSEDKELGVDGHTCKEVGKRQRLVLGAGTMLMEVEHKMLGRHNVEALGVVIKEIGALAYNSLEHVVYVSDLEIRKIVEVDLHTGVAKQLGIADLGRVVSMDFDYLGNNLYWCDSERGTIEVYNFNTRSRTIIGHDMHGEVPESIALIPEEGVMFVAFRHSHQSHVDRLLMDGTGRTHPIEDGLLGPVSLCYDYTLHRVFIADGGTGNIESTSAEGDDRHGFRSLQTSPVGVASLKSDIFWVNRHSKEIFWADKFNTRDESYNRKITLDLPMEVDQMHILSITPRRIGLSPCQKANGGCSHLCLQTPQKITCLCPVGLTLDSDNKTCTKRTHCSPEEFYCSESNTCIARKFRCDGVNNCPKSEDEIDCKKANHCPPNYFQCQDGECVQEEKKCNFEFDCRDKSDERNCSHVEAKKCPPKHFRCRDGQCINERLVCDGIMDCMDEEDEANCVNTVCREKEFRCLSGACISKSWECDHDFDCSDFSDEHADCPSCAPSTFTCTNGKCVDPTFVCDGENDCGDNSDELSCTRTPETCAEGHFSCSLRSLLCLPNSARCNTTAECPNGEDEQSCFSECQQNEFYCKSKKCIPNDWVCDHADDCGDRSDEDPAICNHTIPEETHHGSCQGKYQCKNGNCVDYSLVCNGKKECADGSDEDGVCNTSCNALNNPCDQICVRTPTGPTCQCEEGYHLEGDGKTCEDIDECDSHPSPCSQLCHNIPGLYLCDCYQGFALRNDRTSCKAEGQAMDIIFVENNQIRKLSQTDNSLTLIQDNAAPIPGLEASHNGTIFFSSEASGDIVKIDQKNAKTEFLEGAGQPLKLSLDWLTQNIYYVNNDPQARFISVCNFEDKSCANLIPIEPHRQVSSLAVDSTNKFLFYSLVTWWIFNSPNFVIYRTNLDGTDRLELVKSSSGYITGLTFDLYKKELFFVDQHHNQLSKMKYDGTGRVVIASNLTRPTGLSFFENQVFFQTGGFMAKCRAYKPLTCNAFKFKSELFSLVQETRQPDGVNQCKNHTCSHLCLATSSGYKCLCGDGKVVSAGEGCDSILRESEGSDRKRLFSIHHLEYHASHTGAIIAGVMISICLLVFGILFFILIKKRNSGTFNVISMRFHNPGYGLHRDEAEKAILEPGQHEYTNPVEFFSAEGADPKSEVLVNV